tara:strand:+ start:198 stop:578 length:381 start_codon:yes stop_codon:yes gene_type:complete
MSRPREFYNQNDQRRANRHKKAELRRNWSGRWNKYTINCKEGSEFDMVMQNSLNRSAMVRSWPKIIEEKHELLQAALEREAALEESVTNLLARLNGTRTDADALEDEYQRAAKNPCQMKFDVGEEE